MLKIYQFSVSLFLFYTMKKIYFYFVNYWKDQTIDSFWFQFFDLLWDVSEDYITLELIFFNFEFRICIKRKK